MRTGMNVSPAMVTTSVVAGVHLQRRVEQPIGGLLLLQVSVRQFPAVLEADQFFGAGIARLLELGVCVIDPGLADSRPGGFTEALSFSPARCAPLLSALEERSPAASSRTGPTPSRAWPEDKVGRRDGLADGLAVEMHEAVRQRRGCRGGGSLSPAWSRAACWGGGDLGDLPAGRVLLQELAAADVHFSIAPADLASCSSLLVSFVTASASCFSRDGPFSRREIRAVHLDLRREGMIVAPALQVGVRRCSCNHYKRPTGGLSAK